MQSGCWETAPASIPVPRLQIVVVKDFENSIAHVSGRVVSVFSIVTFLFPDLRGTFIRVCRAVSPRIAKGATGQTMPSVFETLHPKTLIIF